MSFRSFYGLSSVQFRRSDVSDSLRPQGLRQASLAIHQLQGPPMCCRDVCLRVREQRDSENAGRLCGPVRALPAPPASRPAAGWPGEWSWGWRLGEEGEGRRLPVPAFRGRLPSPRRSPSRGQGRGDVQFCGVRGVQPRVVNQKERSKGSPDVDSRQFKTSLDTVSKMCVQLSHVLIFALIPSF